MSETRAEMVERRALPQVAWAVLFLVATAVLVAIRAGDHRSFGLPFDVGVVESVAASAVTVLCAVAIGHRMGSHPLVAGSIAAVLAAVAHISGSTVLLGGVAVATAVLAAITAVMHTVPARSFVIAIRELLVAIVLAGCGAVAVAAHHSEVDVLRFRYVAFAAGVIGALAIVQGLGAGLHGLGRRGLAVMVAGSVLLILTVAYGEALGRWGTEDITTPIETFRDWTRDTLGAVPHPIEVLVGYPALLWGVFMRARRRQGWWVCALGAAGTVSVASGLVDASQTIERAALGEVYSVLLGIALGYVVIRVDQFLTGPRGHRARIVEQEQAERPEPPRWQPLR